MAVMGGVSFLSITMAAVNGVLFTLFPDYKNTDYSHGMATTFLVAFSALFVQIGILTVKLRRQGSGERSRPADRG